MAERFDQGRADELVGRLTVTTAGWGSPSVPSSSELAGLAELEELAELKELNELTPFWDRAGQGGLSRTVEAGRRIYCGPQTRMPRPMRPHQGRQHRQCNMLAGLQALPSTLTCNPIVPDCSTCPSPVKPVVPQSTERNDVGKQSISLSLSLSRLCRFYQCYIFMIGVACWFPFGFGARLQCTCIRGWWCCHAACVHVRTDHGIDVCSTRSSVVQ
jgi:hypothetical protein